MLRCLVVRGLGVIGCLRAEVEWKSIVWRAVELLPSGGEWGGTCHRASAEVSDENLGSLAADGLERLVAVGDIGERDVREWCGLVDFGQDVDTSESSPVDVVKAGSLAYAGDGVTGVDAEFV